MGFLVISGIYVSVCYVCTKSILKNKIIKIDKKLNDNINTISLEDLNKIKTAPNALSLNEMYEIIEKYTDEELNIFANVLVKNFPKEYLLNFFTNLNSLHLNKNIFLPFFGLLGANIPFLVNNNPNVLVLIPNTYIQKIVNNKTTPYHEFFHFASMVKTNDGWGCGFRYFNSVNHFSLGLALNEGYTQLLSERYFQQEKETMGEAFSYKISKKIAKNLEVIVGKDKMEKLYLTANLKGLITELSSYDTVDNIIDFLKTFDALKKMVDNRDSLDITNNPVISDKLLFVQLYLVKIYIRSQLNLNNKLDIDFEQLANNINNFVINLRKDLVIDDFGLKFDLSLLNKEIIDDLLNKEITLKNK